MIKLIRLEWKKNNILKSIRDAAITTAVLLVFMLMTAGELETQWRCTEKECWTVPWRSLSMRPTSFLPV